jgi:ribonuclease Y
MEAVIAAVVVAVALIAAALLVRRPSAGSVCPQQPVRRPPTRRDAGTRARARGALGELRQRAAELEVRAAELEQRAAGLAEQTHALEEERSTLAERRADHERRLERVSGMSAAQARGQLVKEVSDQARHDAVKVLRQVEEQTKRDAERRVRSILAVAMQRLAPRTPPRHRVGRAADQRRHEGPDHRPRGPQHPRAGEPHRIDFIIDDTPNAVVLSGFDGVRREVARMTLERLLQDGRIHPARIEEAFYQARSELEEHIVEVGESAAFEANVQGLEPEIVKLLGRLKFRTSYGQNVLAHSVECAHLAAMMAHELGASATTARRAALLHDIGKAVSHEVEGPHALVGGDLVRRHGEPEAVAHAMEAHHNEVEPQTIEAVIVQAADALSGARPGARGESLESYVKRLRELEHIAQRHDGVEKVYAMQAGREIRIMVQPGRSTTTA